MTAGNERETYLKPCGRGRTTFAGEPGAKGDIRSPLRRIDIGHHPGHSVHASGRETLSSVLLIGFTQRVILCFLICLTSLAEYSVCAKTGKKMLFSGALSAFLCVRPNETDLSHST